MDLELWKQTKKEKRLTLQDISDLSGIPKRTVDAIFVGKTPNPRTDTVQAIERALGLDKVVVADISDEEREFIEALRELTQEEKKEFLTIASFIISKRK